MPGHWLIIMQTGKPSLKRSRRSGRRLKAVARLFSIDKVEECPGSF